MDEPYWKKAVPGSTSPTLMASAVESPVPVTTGVPAARPVSAAAFSVTQPTTSVETAQSAIWSGRQKREHSASFLLPSLL